MREVMSFFQHILDIVGFSSSELLSLLTAIGLSPPVLEAIMVAVGLSPSDMPSVITVFGFMLIAAIVISEYFKERKKKLILGYLSGDSTYKKSGMVNVLFRGREPRKLDSILQELADAGEIEDAKIKEKPPFFKIRRIQKNIYFEEQ
jgi:hypothetical protein